MTNTAWGRSNRAAAADYEATGRPPAIVQTVWFNWADKSLIDNYQALLNAGAEAIVLVANDDEGVLFVRELAALPPARRLPVISHWEITGGAFASQVGSALAEVDLSVIQTFSFFNAEKNRLPASCVLPRRSASKRSRIFRLLSELCMPTMRLIFWPVRSI